jgi:DNA-directed RNA polymerase subunit E'/Rpb7
MQLCEKIKLEPAFISSGYKDEVLKRLKVKVEGICTKHGYIKPDSIELHKICSGRVELIGLNGNTLFDVYFFADVCNPLLGSVIKCRVSNINKFGILAEAGNIIEAIIAKNSVSIHSDVDLEKIRIGDEVMVEVVGKKYELNDKKISLIARIVKNKDELKSFSSSYKKNTYDDEDDEEEVRSIEDVSDVESNEDEDEDEDDGDENDLDELDEIDELDEEDAISEKEGGNFFSDEDDDYFKINEDDELLDDDDVIEESDGEESD